MTDAFQCDGCEELFAEPPEMKIGTTDPDDIAGDINARQKSIQTTSTIGNNCTYKITGGDLCEECAIRVRDFWSGLRETGEGEP